MFKVLSGAGLGLVGVYHGLYYLMDGDLNSGKTYPHKHILQQRRRIKNDPSMLDDYQKSYLDSYKRRQEYLYEKNRAKHK